MRVGVGPPGRWTVELIDAAPVHVWADLYGREGDHYTFSSLVELEGWEELPADAVIDGSNPTNPSQFILAVARFRKEHVALDDDGDEDWPRMYSGPELRRGLPGKLQLFFHRLWRWLPELPAWSPRDRPDHPEPELRIPGGPPPRWIVELFDGRTIEIWAERFAQQHGYYVFSNSVELGDEGELMEDIVVIGEPLRAPFRANLVVARFRESHVRSVGGGADEPPQ